MSYTDRPMLSVEEQIQHLIDKGIKFESLSVEEATQYLKDNNNYFKLRAYRKNYKKDKDDKYIDLDFACLKDLAIIDMRMRYVFIHLALDIEHFAKVKLLHAIEDSSFNGYDIVNDYFDCLKGKDTLNNTHFLNKLTKELEQNTNSPYCGGIIDKYKDDYPVWAFIEIISFGSFIHFYKYCAEVLKDKQLKDDGFLLISVKEIRNAAAHSNCIINDLLSRTASHKTNFGVRRAISGLTNYGISKEKIDTQLKNVRMQQIATLLYTHTRIVTSTGVHKHAVESLAELTRRVNKNSYLYESNTELQKSFDFFEKLVAILFQL